MKKCLFLIATTTSMMLSSCIFIGGRTIDAFPNGDPKVVRHITGFRKFEPCLTEQMFYENGLLRYEKKYFGNDSVPDGQWNFYYDNGQLFASADFTQNHTEGTHWVFYDRNGNSFIDRNSYDSLAILRHDDFGAPIKVSYFTKDQKIVVQYDELHALQKVQYFTYEYPDGPEITYYPNGQAQHVTFYSNGTKVNRVDFRKNGVPMKSSRNLDWENEVSQQDAIVRQNNPTRNDSNLI